MEEREKFSADDEREAAASGDEVEGHKWDAGENKADVGE